MKLTPEGSRLNRDKVKKVAKLANLPLSEEEIEKYTEQLSQILSYVDLLNKVNTEDVEPTFNVTDLVNVMRKDEEGESLSQESALQNASGKKDGQGFFVTKGVFGGN